MRAGFLFVEGAGAQDRADQGRSFAQEGAEVEGRFGARHRADLDDAAAGADEREILGELGLADEVEDDVDRARAEAGFDLGGEVVA